MSHLSTAYHLGALLAKQEWNTSIKQASMQKLGIGQRQMRRILEALAKEEAAVFRNVPKESKRLRQKGILRSIRDLLEDTGTKNPHTTFRDILQQKNIPTEVQKVLNKRNVTGPFNASVDSSQTPQTVRERIMNTLREYKNPKARKHETSGIHIEHTPEDKLRELRTDLQRLYKEQDDLTRIKQVVSGRHSPKDIVTIKMPHTFTEKNLNELQPSRPGIAWRGGNANKIEGEAPIWFSGVPNVSAGYASSGGGTYQPFNSVNTRLRAYDIRKVPKDLQGPWTKHIGVDPWEDPVTFAEAAAGTKRTTGKSVLGELPNYEKVIKAKANPPLVAEYKPLTEDSDIFMRTRGEKLL